MSPKAMSRHVVETELALYAAGDLPLWRGALVHLRVRLHVRRCDECHGLLEALRADRQKLRRSSGFRRLFEGVGEFNQGRLTPGAAKERKPHRQSKDITRGHSDVWIPGNGRRRCAAALGMIAICQIGRGISFARPLDSHTVFQPTKLRRIPSV